MATNQTTYYGLSQWLASDKVERLDFNGDNQKIDEALHGLSAGKADSSTVAALANTVNAKAAQTALTALETTVAGLSTAVDAKAAQSDLAALQKTVNTKASQTDLNTLKTTVNTKAAQSDLTALQNTVNTKAAQSALNTLSATVTSNAAKHTDDVAALRSENCWVKLGETSISANAAKMSVSLPSGHVGAYREFKILAALASPCTSGTRLTVNGLQDEIYHLSGSNYTTAFSLYSSTTDMMSVHLYLEPIGPSQCVFMWMQGTARRSSNYYTLESQLVIPSLSIYDVSSIQIFPTISSSTITAGSSIVIYGLKK